MFRLPLTYLQPLDSAILYIAHNGTYIQPLSEIAKGTEVGNNAVLPFQPGKTYRLRVINMSGTSLLPPFQSNTDRTPSSGNVLLLPRRPHDARH
jgi:hypothetical protein